MGFTLVRTKKTQIQSILKIFLGKITITKPIMKKLWQNLDSFYTLQTKFF